MKFRLRYQNHDLELVAGVFHIGRSGECQLSLDDPLVSRKHALLVVTDECVTLQDLGSRNGVQVNGARLEAPRVLADGDRIAIGNQEMTIVRVLAERAEGPRSGRSALATQTLSMPTPREGVPRAGGAGPQQPTTDPPPDADEQSRRADAFRLLSTVADKALALGRAEDAERVLSTLMGEVLGAAREGRVPGPATVDAAGRYAARLAAATGKGSWVDYVFEMYTLAGRACPAALVDELYGVVRKTTAIDLGVLRGYLSTLRSMADALGPADRFVLQRVEGLERLATSR